MKLEYLLPFIIPLVNFFLQSYPRFLNTQVGIEAWKHLLNADLFRKNYHRIPRRKIKGQDIIEGYFDYPPLFSYLLSYIPKATLLKMQGFIGPFFDSLVVILVYYTAYLLTGTLQIGLLAQLIYMLTPLIAIGNSSLTPRSFGYLAFNLAALPLLYYIYDGNWIYYAVGITFSIVLFLSSRFASQAFFFLSIFLTFFLNRSVFIQALFVGLALAHYLTDGYYLRVLKGHLYRVYFWALNRPNRQIKGLVKNNLRTNWFGDIYRLPIPLLLLALLVLNPWSVSGFVGLAGYYYNYFSITPILYAFGGWIVFFYCLSAIVASSKKLKPLGEGHRYMEMATVPSAVLTAFILFELSKAPYGRSVGIGFIVLAIVALIFILFIQMRKVMSERNTSLDTELENVYAFINKMKTTPRIVSIPQQLAPALRYHTEANVLAPVDGPGLLQIQNIFPFMRTPLKDVANEYDLTHALINENTVTLKDINLPEKNVVYKSGILKLVKL